MARLSRRIASDSFGFRFRSILVVSAAGIRNLDYASIVRGGAVARALLEPARHEDRWLTALPP
jgi:hypothetical protein